MSPSARRSSTRKNTTNPHTRAMADTAPSTARRNCPRQSGLRRHRPFRHGGDGQRAAAEQQTRQQRGGTVQQIQPGSRPGAAEYRHPRHADGKGRAGVVTERQQPRPRQGTALPAHQLRRRPRPPQDSRPPAPAAGRRTPHRRSGRAARRGVPAPGRRPPPPPPAPPAGTKRQKNGNSAGITDVRHSCTPSRTAWAAVSACRSSSIASVPLPSSANTRFIITITGPQPMRAAAGNTPPRTGKFRCVRA